MSSRLVLLDMAGSVHGSVCPRKALLFTSRVYTWLLVFWPDLEAMIGELLVENEALDWNRWNGAWPLTLVHFYLQLLSRYAVLDLQLIILSAQGETRRREARWWCKARRVLKEFLRYSILCQTAKEAERTDLRGMLPLFFWPDANNSFHLSSQKIHPNFLQFLVVWAKLI